MSDYLRISSRTLVLSAFAAAIFAASPVQAFHEGGAGYCEGCHDLHGGGKGYPSLLLGPDPTSTCLRCHGDESQAHAVMSSTGKLYTPGGDFAWLKKTFSWSNAEGSGQSTGERHGHNVVSSELGLPFDGTLSYAPGGEYPASALSCISCHDPHGKISGNRPNGAPIAVSGSYGATAPTGTLSGNFRMLGGAGYADKAGKPFSTEAPIARASTDWQETDRNHTAYGSGMSEWCANCHQGMLGTFGGKKHPAGKDAKLGTSVAANYNYYVRSGILSGSKENAYLALVPFETGATDAASLNPSSTEGPEGSTANVMCLSCHRAHASAFTSMGRWDFKTTFLAESHPRTGDQGAAGGDALHSYYGRDLVTQLGPKQRSLCNKCHAKD